MPWWMKSDKDWEMPVGFSNVGHCDSEKWDSVGGEVCLEWAQEEIQKGELETVNSFGKFYY